MLDRIADTKPKYGLIALGAWMFLATLMIPLWWWGNIVTGNAVALEATGWAVGLPYWVAAWLLPALPSVFQLFLTEDLGGVLKSRAVAIISVLFLMLDVAGPATGWMLLNNLEPTSINLAFAVLRALGVSLVAQHLATVAVKEIFHILTLPSEEPVEIQMGRRPA